MNVLVLLAATSCLFSSALAVKCYACTSLSVDKDAKADYKSQTAYQVRTCTDKNCTDVYLTNETSIADYYVGEACSSFKKDGGVKVVDCVSGCIKITSAVNDRGRDLSRTTRQCAFYDKGVVEKYMNQSGFKRTGSGSDKVSNWYFYCNGDLCNAAAGVSLFPATIIASFYGVLAFLYH